jgi:hypothetical protein
MSGLRSGTKVDNVWCELGDEVLASFSASQNADRIIAGEPESHHRQ